MRKHNQRSGGSRRSGLGGHRGGQGFELGGQWRARSASLYGGLGACPQWGPGAKPLVRGSGGRSPPEANEVFAAESAILG